MRILSLHYPLPNAQIDNKDIFNAPSLFEYDAIIFHPLGFEQSILNWLKGDEEFYTASGEKVVQELSGNNARNINEILTQRRNEIEQFLTMSGLLVTYAIPEMSIFAEQQHAVEIEGNLFSRLFSKIFSRPTLQNELDAHDDQFSTSRYALFNLNQDVNFSELIVPGSGFTNMTVNDLNYIDNQIFQNMLHEHADKISYQGYFDNDTMNNITTMQPLLLTAKSGIPIAASLEAINGQIVFLPNFIQGNTDEAMTEARLLVDDIVSIMNK